MLASRPVWPYVPPRADKARVGARAAMAEFGMPDTRASVDQIVRELAADFDGMSVDTIQQLVIGSFDELSQGARIERFLPVLAKRVARERLRGQSTSAA